MESFLFSNTGYRVRALDPDVQAAAQQDVARSSPVPGEHRVQLGGGVQELAEGEAFIL